MPPSARDQPGVSTRLPGRPGELASSGALAVPPPSGGRRKKPSSRVPSGAKEPLRPPFPEPFLRSSHDPATQPRATHSHARCSDFGGRVHSHFLARGSYREERLVTGLLLSPNSLQDVQSTCTDIHTHANNRTTSGSNKCFHLFRTQTLRTYTITFTGNRLIFFI